MSLLEPKDQTSFRNRWGSAEKYCWLDQTISKSYAKLAKMFHRLYSYFFFQANVSTFTLLFWMLCNLLKDLPLFPPKEATENSRLAWNSSRQESANILTLQTVFGHFASNVGVRLKHSIYEISPRQPVTSPKVALTKFPFEQFPSRVCLQAACWVIKKCSWLFMCVFKKGKDSVMCASCMHIIPPGNREMFSHFCLCVFLHTEPEQL